MISKKLVLVSGLVVASLSLTGCSGLQDMINNKIASTTKQVADGVNSEVAKTTDALKAQGEVMQKDFDQAGSALKADLGLVTPYINTAAGFSLQFPTSWGKVTAKETDAVTKDKTGETKLGKNLAFTFENSSKKYSVTLVDKNATENVLGHFEYNPVLGTTSKYKVIGQYEGGLEGSPVDTEITAINKSFKAL